MTEFGPKFRCGLETRFLRDGKTRERSRPNFAWSYFGLAKAPQHQEKLEEAVASYQAALKLAPNAAHCHRGLGHALYKKEELNEAITFLKKSTELSPKYLAAYNQLGEALTAKGNLKETAARYEKAIYCTLI
jgi:tetratricopeptide (TPR) repeat protein